MQAAINTLVQQFKHFAGSDGNAATLSKEEFRKLVISQLPDLVKDGSDPAVSDKLFKSIDVNDDGELNFMEFWKLIGQLAINSL
ncbi:protein S100-A11 [Polypterus senegalus]|uniref:protein S100-A11 n=1 Tax=Polypterus senegalus TaxID=55291 RepID=UPI0019643CCA|nr:protein S100-A11 [Polypterus senegalus]